MLRKSLIYCDAVKSRCDAGLPGLLKLALLRRIAPLNSALLRCRTRHKERHRLPPCVESDKADKTFSLHHHKPTSKQKFPFPFKELKPSPDLGTEVAEGPVPPAAENRTP